MNTTIPTDFYKVHNRVYYITKDPLDEKCMYCKQITQPFEDLSYSSMKKLRITSAYVKEFINSTTPFNIGWVPNECNVAQDYPELLL